MHRHLLVAGVAVAAASPLSAQLIVGAGSGSPHVRVFASQLPGGAIGESAPESQRANFFAFDPAFQGGVSVAAGDVNNDGVADIIVGAATGLAHVRVIDGTKLNATAATGEPLPESLLGNFFAFGTQFTGGVNVAGGDVNGDGFDDIIVGANAGGGPHVRVIDGTRLNDLGPNGTPVSEALLADFFAYDPSFTGGVRVAAGDVNSDGTADIITGSGPGAPPHVRIFEAPYWVATGDLFPKPQAIGGVRVAAGDVNGDGFDDIILGAGHTVEVHDRNDSRQPLIARFALPFSPDAADVHVAAGDVNGDGFSDIVTSAGTGGTAAGSASDGPRVIVVGGSSAGEAAQHDGSLAPAAVLADFFAFDPQFTGGVFVAASDVNGLKPVPTMVGKAVYIEFDTEPGRNYVLRRSYDLEHWDIIEAIKGDGEPKTRFFKVTKRQAFYGSALNEEAVEIAR